MEQEVVLAQKIPSNTYIGLINHDLVTMPGTPKSSFPGLSKRCFPVFLILFKPFQQSSHGSPERVAKGERKVSENVSSDIVKFKRGGERVFVQFMYIISIHLSECYRGQPS